MFRGVESAEVVSKKAEGESMLLISAVGERLTICKETKSELLDSYLNSTCHFSKTIKGFLETLKKSD